MKLRLLHAMHASNMLVWVRQCGAGLWDYDFWSEMKSCPVRGTFVAGSGDGKLPESMKQMAAGYGSGTGLSIVDGAGHLPMVEKPQEVARLVADFLDAR